MSELSQISTMNSKQDVDKQIAYIRSYLIQLKDEIESELNNVTYDMLSASLKKRIDMINDDVVVSGEDKSNGALVLDSLLAQYASIGTLIATVGEIQTLTSMLATINTVVAEVGTITTLTAKTATVNQGVGCASLTATGNVKGSKGVFDEIDIGDDTKGITIADSDTGTSMSPKPGKALTINGGGTGTDQSAGQITMGTGRFGTLQIHTQGGYKEVSTQQITLSDGTQVTVLKI